MKRISKLIIAMLVFLVLAGGSLSVVFANSSVSDVLSTWITDKTDESIHEIEEEIQMEQEKQTRRLETVLADEIARVETEFDAFLEEEKEKRVEAISAYADKRVQEIPQMFEKNREAQVKKELENILNDAIQAMNQVNMEPAEAVEEEITEETEREEKETTETEDEEDPES